MSRAVRCAAVLALAAVLLLVPACSGGAGSPVVPSLAEVAPPEPGSCAILGGLTLVVSGHANSPAGSLPEPLVRLLADVARTSPEDGTGRRVTVREVTAPATVDSAVSSRFRTSGLNPVVITEDRQTEFSTWFRAVHDLRATSGEVDVLGALGVAARFGEVGTIALVDPGLQTVPPLDFTRSPLLGADPAEVVRFLQSNGDLPELAGHTVILAGIGDTSPPQEPLNDPQRRGLIALWRAIAEAGGACVEVVDEPRTGPPPPAVPAVEPVEVPDRPEIDDRCSGVLDQGSLQFVARSADFIDQTAAGMVVQPVADCLLATPSRTVLLTGTTACAGDAAGREELSRLRAEAVGTLLVDRGVDPSQIRTRGVGSEFPEYLPDRAGNVLLPGPAAANRSVRITPFPSDGPEPADHTTRCTL